MMKSLVVAIALLFSANLMAQSRGQLLEDVRQISSLVKEETYNSQANSQSLRQARELLEEAYELVGGSRGGSDILCARANFGYIPTNTASGVSYGENVSSIDECQRMLPPRGAKALCAKSRFGFQPMAIDRALFIGDDYFSSLDACLEVAPTFGQNIMCAKVRFGYSPYNIDRMLQMGDYVATASQCQEMLPVRGSQLMCIKISFGFQAINISSGRAFGQRTSTLDQCHRLINQ